MTNNSSTRDIKRLIKNNEVVKCLTLQSDSPTSEFWLCCFEALCDLELVLFLNLSFPACKISIVKNVLPRIIVITEWNNIVAFAFILVKKHSRGNIMELKLPPCLQPWMNLAEQTIWGPQCVHYSRDAWMQWHSPCSVGLHSLAGEESAQRSRVSGIVTPCLWCHSLWSKGFFLSVFHLTEWKQCGSLSAFCSWFL